MVLAVGLFCSPVCAQTYQVLYSFCSQANCADGSMPILTALVMDQAGNIYGTTGNGGTKNEGVIFKLTPGAKGQYAYQVLYSFCALADCADGSMPYGAPIVDTAGNVYGATTYGGPAYGGSGEVYELSPNNGSWTLNVLYGFCVAQNCPDGASPTGISYAGQGSGSLYNGTAPLFGTTSMGGAGQGGMAFELQRGENGWSQQDIYNFCLTCKDGSYPTSPMIVDSSGNLYGTTILYNNRDKGVAYALIPANGAWTETVLHIFCHGKGCPDGEWPWTSLAENGAGDLVGMTDFGGIQSAAYCGTSKKTEGCGVVYLIVPNSEKLRKSVESTLYDFCSLANCVDGIEPAGPPVFDAQGDVYGATQTGGVNKAGTIFELSGSTLQTLYSFCSQSECADGRFPTGGVIRDAAGNLYGMTALGGANGYGAVFKLMP
jgi:uncharacterized repeat protein (TIGR03803 family)